MKVIYGYFIILIFIICFIFSLTGTIEEVNNRVDVTKVLDQSINLETMNISETSYMKDQNGEIISEIYDAENRISLPYESIPRHVVNAFIATEDQHFYTHKGFDLFGIGRAFLVNAQNEEIEQGGSTITQQLIRQVYLNNEKSYNRKLNELLFAYQLEKELPKEKIIELYINTIYFQNQAYGIEAAANFYFSKPAQELTLAEAAFLCTIPNNPAFYNPLEHFDRTKKRQQLVLEKMLEAKLISNQDYEQARNEKISLSLNKKIDLYPNYVTYIYDELKQLIAKETKLDEQLQNAATPEDAAQIEAQLKRKVEELLKSGVTIETALNPALQTVAENTLKQTLQNTSIEGAIVIINHRSNEINAIVGGKDYKKHDFHRAFQSYRQPGSAIKPLLVYGPYLAKFGGSIRSTINASFFCKNGYCPKNASGRQYGNVSLETALKYSYNTAAVRMFNETGIRESFAYVKPFQFSKVVPDDYHLPAAIGGFTYGLTPLELTSAYTTFANDGTYRQPHAIQQVVDRNGNVLYKWNDETPKIVWDVDTNQKMRTLLHKVITEGTGKKAYVSGYSYIGGKTGTTNDYKDLWFIGLNEDFTTGVWLGKDQPSSIKNHSTNGTHLKVWKSVMQQISNR